MAEMLRKANGEEHAQAERIPKMIGPSSLRYLRRLFKLSVQERARMLARLQKVVAE